MLPSTFGMLEAPTLFMRHVQCLMVFEYAISQYHWKHHLALFLLVRRVMAVDERFVASDRFFFLPYSLSSIKNTSILFFFLFFNFILYVTDCLFQYFTILKKFLIFSIQFLNYNMSYIIVSDSLVLISNFFSQLFC